MQGAFEEDAGRSDRLPHKGTSQYANAKRELLAALAHERWSAWMEYMFGIATVDPEGNLVIPAQYVARWARQMKTPYVELPDDEKESDRREADMTIAVWKSQEDLP